LKIKLEFAELNGREIIATLDRKTQDLMMKKFNTKEFAAYAAENSILQYTEEQ